MAKQVTRAYRRGMTDPTPVPDVMALYDTDAGSALVCRTCGALVSGEGSYPRAHWDWHEASNGA